MYQSISSRFFLGFFWCYQWWMTVSVIYDIMCISCDFWIYIYIVCYGLVNANGRCVLIWIFIIYTFLHFLQKFIVLYICYFPHILSRCRSCLYYFVFFLFYASALVINCIINQFNHLSEHNWKCRQRAKTF